MFKIPKQEYTAEFKELAAQGIEMTRPQRASRVKPITEDAHVSRRYLRLWKVARQFAGCKTSVASSTAGNIMSQTSPASCISAASKSCADISLRHLGLKFQVQR